MLSLVVSLGFLLHGIALIKADTLGTMTGDLMTTSQLATLNSIGYSDFFGNYFNGSLVTNPNTILGTGGLDNGVNNNGIQSIKAANAALNPNKAATPVISAYHVPSYTTSAALPSSDISGTGGIFSPYRGKTNIFAQARWPIDKMNNAGAWIMRTYIVVSRYVGSNWSGSQTSNQNFMTSLLSNFPTLGPQCGIVTNQTEFQAIFGTTYQAKDKNNNLCELVEWSCNGNADRNGPTPDPFNGWTLPAAKMYFCNVTNVNGYTGVTANLFSYAY